MINNDLDSVLAKAPGFSGSRSRAELEKAHKDDSATILMRLLTGV